jgi:hypothetical protein
VGAAEEHGHGLCQRGPRVNRGDPREVAGELVDPDHRLPGEEESELSSLIEDAVHWQRVYEELLTFKRTLLRTAEVHKKEDAPEPVAHEVASDQIVLHSEMLRLERRHRFWQERVRELQAGIG